MAAPPNTWIDRLNTFVGQSVSWVSLLLVALVCIDVVLRYSLKVSYNWVLELEWHFFAILILLPSGYTLLADQHVRVDVWYSRWSIRRKAWVNVTGHLLLLIPWCLVVIKTGYTYAANSWYMREGSDQPGGLPARYLIKSMILMAFLLLLLQGLSLIYQDIRLLTHRRS